MVRKGTRIQIVEDEIIVANDIQKTLLDAGYKVSGLAHDFKKALDNFKSKIPDLLICDINLGNGPTGIDLVREIHKIKHIPVIFLSAYSDDETVNAALKTSPDSYLSKPFTREQLLISVKRILKNSVDNAEVKINKLPRPTRRELDIIYCISQGDSSRSIAKKFNISFETVQTHRKNIFNKYKVNSSGELIAIAHKHKWLK